jgi:hypothetical protein
VLQKHPFKEKNAVCRLSFC